MSTFENFFISNFVLGWYYGKKNYPCVEFAGNQSCPNTSGIHKKLGNLKRKSCLNCRPTKLYICWFCLICSCACCYNKSRIFLFQVGIVFEWKKGKRCRWYRCRNFVSFCHQFIHQDFATYILCFIDLKL